MSAPTVPPRPQRAQAGPTAVGQQTPQVPPRPTRKYDPSPVRDTRSPLNDLPPTAMSNTHNIYAHGNLSASDLPRRPPSVASLPSIGQEGVEYASYDQLPPEAHGVKDSESADVDTEVLEQTRHADVPMHAPTASVPLSTAKSRISAVTRTDSSQAVAAGIAKPKLDDDHSASSSPLSRVPTRPEDSDPLRRVPSREPHPLRAKASFSRSTQSLHSNGTPRPESVHSLNEQEHGIPLIGLQVPMYPNAGDVQAPSPGPGHGQFPAGIGYFNDGSARNHQRKRSSRHEFGPPGSYGLHGHPGQEPSDQFEREWIAKHPDIAAKEGYNVYGGLQPRPATAMSSDQLNRLVREGDDVGFGTSRNAVGTPDQEIGYRASEEYAARLSSPKPSPLVQGEPRKRPSDGANPAVESPLRKSFPFHQSAHDTALDSEDENTIHINPPVRRANKITGGGDVDGALDLGPDGGNTAEEGGWYDERGVGTPILASDEIIKRPGSAYLQPAISPELERGDEDFPSSRRGSLQHGSRPSSRPGSVHGHPTFGGPIHRLISHDSDHHASGMGTPLEEIEEYEPLFPEDELKASSLSKAQQEKLKKRFLAAHQFPSRDIWEDTPASLQFTTNVDTPEPLQEPGLIATAKSTAFETPEQEQRRRAENPEDMTSTNKTFAKPHFKGLHHDLDRPGAQRFPSHDIWEDTPDSMRLVTTVSSPQIDDDRSQPEERPTTSAIPGSQDDANARASTGLTQLMKPAIPGRPQQKSKLSQEITPEDSREKEVPDLGVAKKAPVIPDRPKPSVPARPAKYTQAEQTDSSGAPLAKSASATSDGSASSESTVTSPPAQKAKPAVPARPAGNKFGALRANFMNDLNSRLQLGPQASQPRAVESEEAEAALEEKAPLVDARKGRAKGPARRKAGPTGGDGLSLSFLPAITVWHIDESDQVKIPLPLHEVAELGNVIAANEATNLEASPPSLTSHVREQIGAEGDLPEPTISSAAASEQKSVQSTLEKSLAGAETAPTSAEETQHKHLVAKAVQTGEQSVTTQHPSGGQEKLTAYIGAKAPEEGNVIVRDGEEVANPN